MASLRLYSGYDPEIVARSLNRLGRTISDITANRNRHERDMANLGLMEARQTYNQGLKTRALDSQLAEAKYGRKQSTPQTIPSLLGAIGMKPEKIDALVRQYAENGIDLNSEFSTLADITQSISAFNKELRTSQNRGKLTESEQAEHDARMANLAKQSKYLDLQISKLAETGKTDPDMPRGTAWQLEKFNEELAAANIFRDKNGQWMRTVDDGMGVREIPAGQLVGQIKSELLKETQGVVDTMNRYNIDPVGAKEKLRIGKTGGPQIAGLAAAIRGPQAQQQTPEQPPQRGRVSGYGLRANGTQKGTGFLGELKRPDGSVSTEISIGVEIDGKETEIPTLVPTLTGEEVDYLLNGESLKTPTGKRIVEKAVDHAKMRLSAGKSPFAQHGESSPLIRQVIKTPEERNLAKKKRNDRMSRAFLRTPPQVIR